MLKVTKIFTISKWLGKLTYLDKLWDIIVWLLKLGIFKEWAYIVILIKSPDP